MPDSQHLSQKHWLDSLPGQIAIGSAISIIYLFAYLRHPILPGNIPAVPLGWWGWADQGHYLKCARAIANWTLDRSTYTYPIGYSLLGAIGYKSAPQHAFCIPN